MSTIRVRSPASYWLAVPAAAWMLGVVGVPFLGVNGVINQTLMAIGATQSPIEAFLYSKTGITMAQVSLYTMMAAGPVVYMLNAVVPQWREAAMTLKATPFTVFWRIVFPLTLPGLVIGQVLVFLNVMSDFATVATTAVNNHDLPSNSWRR